MYDPVKKRYFYTTIAGFGAISLSIVLFFLLYRMKGIGEVVDSLVQILAPFIYGGVVAYLLRPMCNGFEGFFNRRLPGKLKEKAPVLAIFCSFVVASFVIYALIAMVAPQIYDSVIRMWSAIPAKVREFLAWAEVTFGEDERFDALLNSFNTSYEKLYTELGNWVSGTLVPQVTTVLTGVGSSMFKVLRVAYNLLIGFIVAVYVLFSRKRFARQAALLVRGLLPEKAAEMVLREAVLVDKMFGGFIDAKILDSTIIGFLCYFGCILMNIPNALIVSVVIGITNIIPFFGPFIGAIPTTLLILIDDPIKSLWFVVFVVVLQQLDGNVIGPRIMGNRIGISGFWVMFAIILFGGLWGVVGMVIGVPLFAVIYDLIKRFVRNGLQKKGKIEMWEQYTADFPSDEIQPVLDGRAEMAQWSKEDWERYIRKAWQECREGWRKLCAVVSVVWAFVSKWMILFWRFVKKCCVVCWLVLKMVWNWLCALVKRFKKS